tara:strand:- start:3667 stop:4743 length:1077 start_codon:yes stop_codon:yes gene_type:complete
MSSPVRQLAEQYLQNVKPSGRGNYRAACPFHDSSSAKRSFYIYGNSGGWSCFGCGLSGTLPSLLYRLGLSRTQVDKALDGVSYSTWRPDSTKKRGTIERQSWDVLPEYILGAWDWCPQRMIWWGFSEEVLQKYGIGYDKIHQRITFPIRDYLGRLVGISGRAEPGGFPRYKVYDASPPDEHGRGAGELYEVLDRPYTPDNRRHLYGLDRFYASRVLRPDDDHPPVVLVEGYKGVLWMVQNEFIHTTGLQGSSLTRAQESAIGMIRGTKIVLLDHEPGKSFPDENGRCAAYWITERLSRYGPALVCQYPEGTEIGTSPDDLTKDQLQGLIKEARPTAKARLQRSGQQDGWTRSIRRRST